MNAFYDAFKKHQVKYHCSRRYGDRKDATNSSLALVTGSFMQVVQSEALGDLRGDEGEGSGRNNRGALNWNDGGGRRRGRRGRGKDLRSSYETIKKEPAVLHPSSALLLTADSEWVIFHEFVVTKQPFIRIVTNIKQGWLVEYASESYNAYTDRETKSALQAINVRVEKGEQKTREKREKDEKQKEKKKSKGKQRNDT